MELMGAVGPTNATETPELPQRKMSNYPVEQHK